MGDKEIQIQRYADETTEDDLKRRTHKFNSTIKKYNKAAVRKKYENRSRDQIKKGNVLRTQSGGISALDKTQKKNSQSEQTHLKRYDYWI